MRDASTWLLFIAALVGLLAAPLSAAAQASTTTLETRVVNGTAGGGPVEGLPVTLQAFRGDQEAGRWEATAGQGGAVRFEGLDPADDLIYLLSAPYAGTHYFSLPVSLAQPSELPVALVVYETTEDAAAVRILGDSTVILGAEGDSGTLQAMQVTTYQNTGDRTFIGAMGPGGRRTVQVPLPPGAFDVEAAHDPGSRVSSEDDAVFSTYPLLPGTEEFIVIYRILYVGKGYEWSKTYLYAVDQVRLLVAPAVVVDLGPGWQSLPAAEIGSGTYAHWSTPGGPAGTRVAARLSGLPASAGSRSQRLERALRFAGLGIVAVALVGAGAYVAFWALRRRRRTAPAPAPSAGPAAAREEALERLARLDEEFEAGRLNEAEYNSQRETERQALRRLLEERA
ncbi:MAG: hypothetical protein HY688_04520 [Chloroflexi bacterium]|nr:hypothetical protein [Chloroflexota bacterium]